MVGWIFGVKLSLLIAPVIIYVQSRVECSIVSEQLKSKGHEAAAYHAGMGGPDRTKVQNQFLRNKCRIIVATGKQMLLLKGPEN